MIDTFFFNFFLTKIRIYVTKQLFSRLIYTTNLNFIMSFFRVLFAIIFPPLSVIDKGCGSFFIIFLLTLCGWIPGVIGALVILNNPKN
tara:strand:- start:1239 stop:1502 length:264 start_codon:yes stop_codon:yes gene_type:complete